MTRLRIPVLGAALLAVAACGNLIGPPTTERVIDPVDEGRGPQESITDAFGGFGFGNVSVGERVEEDALVGRVNKYLWRAALDTLAFLPLASTDPFTGIIATEWGGPQTTPDERFRVTVFVDDVALTPEALRVAVFRERREPEGPWTAAPVSAETPRRIEDAILVRARQLRLAERGEG